MNEAGAILITVLILAFMIGVVVLFFYVIYKMNRRAKDWAKNIEDAAKKISQSKPEI
jgi:heme/copper-type cytochrome/quinol oxidase subunit 2